MNNNMWEYKRYSTSDELYHAGTIGQERQNHKYVQRIALSGGGYRYIYPEDLKTKAKRVAKNVKVRAGLAVEDAKLNYTLKKAKKNMAGEKTVEQKVKDSINTDKANRDAQYQKYKKKQDTIKKIKQPVEDLKIAADKAKKDIEQSKKKRKQEKAKKKVNKMIKKNVKATTKSVSKGYNKLRYYLENRK